MFIVKEYSMLEELSFVSILFKTTILLLTIVLLVFAVPLSAEVYFCDNFDAQDEWHPTVCDGQDPERIPPSPWDYVQCDTELFINSSAAHGGSGKGFGINWPKAMDAIGLYCYEGSGNQEVWIGFWYKHNSWNWGSDQTQKWFRFHSSSGQNVNLNFDRKHRIVLDSMGDTIQSDISFDTNDTGWHSWIIYLKHDSVGQSNGQIRLWKDGVEANWYYAYTSTPYNNLAINWGSGSTWADYFSWGWQSRPDWGSGNKSYFDDIIVASTKEEVEEFLAISGDDNPIVSVAATDPLASEEGPEEATYRISCSPDCSNISVNFDVSGDVESTDYNLSDSSPVTIDGSYKDIILTPVDDSDIEGSETATLTLHSGDGYSVGGPSSATVTIADNDAPTVPEVPQISITATDLMHQKGLRIRVNLRLVVMNAVA